MRSVRTTKTLNLVRRARRRFLWNEVAAQSALAVTLALGTLVLLLLLGTQVLDWKWLVLIPSASLAFGIWRTVRHLPSLYGIAQLVDRRLALSDTISTALFFANCPPDKRVSEPVREAQLAEAEQMSEPAGLKRAIPFQVPRAVYAAVLLGFVASSLFALRYGIDRKLDLEPPLPRILRQAWAASGGRGETAQKQETKAQHKRAAPPDTVGLSLEDQEGNNSGQLDVAHNLATGTTGVPNADDNKSGTKSGASQMAEPDLTQSPEGERRENEAAEDVRGSPGGESAAEGQQGSSKKGLNGRQSHGNQASGAAGTNSSLMSRLREAMSSLLSRMRPQSGGSASQQQAAQGQTGSVVQSQAQNLRKSGGQGQQTSSAQNAKSQDGAQNGAEQSAENASGKGAGENADEQSAKQPGSGVGREDGSKDVKLAEQLKAMGKISEIIGKRSANVTGEVTVEVESTSQRLATPYVQRNAEHADTGGEISRDEVPVPLQSYIQRYFEQVRKPSPDAPGQRHPKR